MFIKLLLYELDFIKPIDIFGTLVSKRRGLLLLDPKTNQALSECAPLPGLSRESLEECISWFKSFDVEVKNYVLFDEGLPSNTPPSIQFALDSYKETQVDGFSECDIQLNSLLLDVNDLKTTESCVIKIKVGRRPLKDDLSFLKQLKINSKIRFDANRAWILDEAYQFYEATSHLNIDYIEEPLIDLNDLALFHKNTQCPIALDESINIDKRIHDDWSFVSVFVIKPTRFGSIREIRRLKQKFQNQTFIFSSCFESELGLIQISRLAREFSSESVHGLNTLHYFKEGLISYPLISNNILTCPNIVILKESKLSVL